MSPTPSPRPFAPATTAATPSTTGPRLPEGVDLRALDDAASGRRAIFDRVRAAAAAFEPVAMPTHSLALENVDYDPDDPEEVPGPAEVSAAMLRGGTLGRRLRGEWVLRGAEGDELARRKTVLARVPYLTDLGTFVHRGTAYAMGSQSRQRPGVYARRKANGELESLINAVPGKGTTHRIELDAATGALRVRAGQARIPLLPLLKAVGVPDAELRKRWGPQIYAANLKIGDNGAVSKMLNRARGPHAKGDPPVDPGPALREALEKTELDPQVTRRTLGRPVDRWSPDVWLDAADRLFAINRGEAEPDDRDQPSYLSVHGPEDLLAERIGRSKALARKLLWRGAATGRLDHISAGALAPAINAALVSSGVAQSTEALNPLLLMEQRHRITRMGQGGIQSDDAVSDAMREVQFGQAGYVDILSTPESSRVGVDLRIAVGARKGSDGKLYTPVKDLKTGEVAYRPPDEVADTPMALPGALDATRRDGRPTRRVFALVNNKIRPVPRAEVRWELPNFEEAYGPSATMVPMKGAMKGQRAMMVGRFLTQSMPLVDPEAPLVRAARPQGGSFEAHYGKAMGALRAQDPGVVVEVKPDGIVLRPDGAPADGSGDRTIPLSRDFFLGRKTRLHQTPLVEPGQRVDAGAILARSNYTDDSGVTSLGKNARVAYMPHAMGGTYEDAIAVSESFAKRMSSESMYRQTLDFDDRTRAGLKDFVSAFPAKFDRRALGQLDERGVVRPGTVLQPGDPMALAVRERTVTRGDLSSGKAGRFADASLVWEHDFPGVVAAAHADEKGARVLVNSVNPLQIGDKLGERSASKGVVGVVLSDDDMPKDENGLPYEVLMNDLAITKRGNPAQLHEMALGKIAAKTGKPYEVPDFGKIDDLREYVAEELKKHGMKPTADVTLPNGAVVPGVADGVRYFLKLSHMSEGKESGRDGGGYSIDERPAKGGYGGAKTLGIMGSMAILSAGATEVLRDSGLIRGQDNPEYWAATMSGHEPPTPRVPLVWKKFVDTMRASGVNLVKDGTRFNVMALTEKDVDQLAGDRELRNAETVEGLDSMKPIKGGLFSEELTGGPGGSAWSFIRLPEPYPQPILEEPIRRLLGLTEAKFRDVLAGKEKIGNHSGPGAIGAALKSLDLDKEAERARLDFERRKGPARDDAARRLRYLRQAKKTGVHPGDWLMAKVPVLPPVFRPIADLGGTGTPVVADANVLYRELFAAKDNLAQLGAHAADLGPERLAVYDAYKAVVGLGDPIQPRTKEQKVKGLLQQVFGSSPKQSMVQRKLLASQVDLVGRAVVSPDANLGLDQAGIPESTAWDVYRKFVIRRLRRDGMPLGEAARHVKDRDPRARKALLRELEERPVIIDRAPVLHRYGTMAFRPVLVPGHTLRVNQLITAGMNMDFDGDQSNYQVPADDKAVKDALAKMLPSKNLFAASTFKVHQKPSGEFAAGLYKATRPARTDRRPAAFASPEAVAEALRKGLIGWNDPIELERPPK